MNQAGHWTNDELLASLYGVGPSGDHLPACADCQSRLSAMQRSRKAIERSSPSGDAVSASFLAAQRRTIYRRLDERPVRWRSWVACLTTAGVLACSLFLYQQNHEMKLEQERASDAKLVQEVAAMATDTGTSSMAPLEGLFE